ncbi:hypothetical protein E2C01_074466 [Portunus trituberculatus]|uniref:Uncharacterized protein n=1 Tax=Portunus trituberculatus TaxID=210409 RepID=A0A5B7I5Q9_PORTR|nr:hypothetical protein [Portunus trituberculatus]
MSFDLGLDDLDTHMDTVLRDAIKILDDTFHLVMVTHARTHSPAPNQHTHTHTHIIIIIILG